MANPLSPAHLGLRQDPATHRAFGPVGGPQEPKVTGHGPFCAAQRLRRQGGWPGPAGRRHGREPGMASGKIIGPSARMTRGQPRLLRITGFAVQPRNRPLIGPLPKLTVQVGQIRFPSLLTRLLTPALDHHGFDRTDRPGERDRHPPCTLADTSNPPRNVSASMPGCMPGQPALVESPTTPRQTPHGRGHSQGTRRRDQATSAQKHRGLTSQVRSWIHQACQVRRQPSLLPAEVQWKYTETQGCPRIRHADYSSQGMAGGLRRPLGPRA